MKVRTLWRCYLLLLDWISMVSEMFVIFRYFVKFDKSGMQNFSLFGKSQNGRPINQERFKSTLSMSKPVDHHVITLGSNINCFQHVWQFSIFRQTWQLQTCIFITIIEHVRYPAPISQWTSGPYQDAVYYSWMGYPKFLKCLSFCDFSSNLTGPNMQNFSFFGKSKNGRSIDQECFKSTLSMS